MSTTRTTSTTMRTRTMKNASSEIVNKMIDGYKKSMRLGDIINMFSDLLIENDPRANEDFFDGTKESFVSQIIFEMINTPFTKMVIKTQEEGSIVLETNNIDMMYIALKYYCAYVEDSMPEGGFCWYNRNDEKHYKVNLI